MRKQGCQNVSTTFYYQLLNRQARIWTEKFKTHVHSRHGTQVEQHWFHGTEDVLGRWWSLNWSKISRSLKEPFGSLVHTLGPSSRSYLEPFKCRPYVSLCLFMNSFNIILYCTSQVISPFQFSRRYSFSPCALRVPPASYCRCCSGLWRRTDR